MENTIGDLLFHSNEQQHTDHRIFNVMMGMQYDVSDQYDPNEWVMRALST